MKKLTMIAVAMIGCFLMASCTKSPKEAIMKATDAFFAQAENDVKTITNADDFLKFFTDFEEKKEAFLMDLFNKYDSDDEGNFTALSAEENEALYQYMYDRATEYNKVEAEKCNEMLDPYITRIEKAFANYKDDPSDDDYANELEAAIRAMEPFDALDNVPTELVDRYQTVVDELDEFLSSFEAE